VGVVQGVGQDGIWMCDRQFDHGKHGMKAAEVGRESKTIYALADACFNNKGA
jgi:hypothetical protein